MNCKITENKKNIKSRLVFGKRSDITPMFSIVTPTYTRIDLLKKTIESIKAQNNLYKYHVEVLIVSNDSKFDYTKLNTSLDPEIFSVYVNEENLGMCGNMNRCAILASGDYVIYIQDDDVLLPNYLDSVIELVESGKMNNIDCLIPNRYYLMPNDEGTQFGKKASRNIFIKNKICKILRLGVKVPKLMRINPYESMITTYPFYSGGPTCGIMFKRESLFSTKGFNEDYPYGFDYDFFMYFSEKYNVYLYDDFLSIYMTGNSASVRSEVQYDFFRARYDYLLNNYKRMGITEKLKNIIAYSTYCGYPVNTRKMIDESYEVKKVSKLLRIVFNIWARGKVYSSGGYRRAVCPANVQEWYRLL